MNQVNKHSLIGNQGAQSESGYSGDSERTTTDATGSIGFRSENGSHAQKKPTSDSSSSKGSFQKRKTPRAHEIQFIAATAKTLLRQAGHPTKGVSSVHYTPDGYDIDISTVSLIYSDRKSKFPFAPPVDGRPTTTTESPSLVSDLIQSSRPHYYEKQLSSLSALPSNYDGQMDGSDSTSTSSVSSDVSDDDDALGMVTQPKDEENHSERKTSSTAHARYVHRSSHRTRSYNQ